MWSHMCKHTRVVLYLSEDKWLFVVDRIQPIVGNGSCPKLLAYCVGRQSIHVYFHVCSNFFVGQKLTGDNLRKI